MKKIEIIAGIIAIVTGSIFFEMGYVGVKGADNWGYLIQFFGLTLLVIGVFIYLLVVDSLNENKESDEKIDIFC